MPILRTPLTLLDACAVVNLFATRQIEHILLAVGGPVAVVDVVEQETQYVLRGGTGDAARERDPVDLSPLVVDGLLEILATNDEEELLTFIDLSQEVDPGEAMTAALAIHRDCVVVTDDQKATRVLTDRGVTLRTSLDLVRAWSESQAIAAEVRYMALVDMRQRGNYVPPRRHPLRRWWDEVLC